MNRKLPRFIKPMLATLVEEPFDDPDWLFEVKWDGYRALAYIGNHVKLYSRNNNEFTIFPLIVKELSKLKINAVLDGEIVLIDKKGRSDFQLMQNYQRTQKGALYFYVFDLLYLDGKDMRLLPLVERKEKLKSLLSKAHLEHIRYSDHIVGKGVSFFKKAMKLRLEGIMAKHILSEYHSKRSKEWLKIKTHLRQEAVIGGFTKPRESRKHFGALLLGVYNERKEFIYIGHVGTGFTQKTLKEIYTLMKPLIQKKSPFHQSIKTNTPATWIKPKLVCELSFSEWTKDNLMRQPVFEGLRIDKPARQVKKE